MRTEIATLGEFGLIDRLTKDIKLTQPTSIRGVGDDAAIIDNKDNTWIVALSQLNAGLRYQICMF